MSRNHNSEGASNENQWLKWVFSLLLLAIGVGCAALAMRWIGTIMGYPVPSTPKFITVYWIASITFVLYAITWIFQGASYAWNLIGGVFLLAIGVGFATFAISPFIALENVELSLISWTACFFFLIYGATRIFLSETLSGTLQGLVVVVILAGAVILALLIVTLLAKTSYILQIQMFLFYPLLMLLPLLLYSDVTQRRNSAVK